MAKLMISTRNVGRTLLLAIICVTNFAIANDSRPPPLPIEPLGVIESLPAAYPERWFLVHDASFFHMSDGKVYVIDATADSSPEQVKGMFNVVAIGSIIQSAKRGEIYATETFQSRGTRGVRTDALTIWSMTTLEPVAEVILPTGKRYTGIPTRHAMLLLNKSRWLAIANISPATSVTLIDIEKRKILAEIPTPGCSFVYPNGPHGFSSLCADGRFMSTELNKDGTVREQVRTDAFFSSDDSPIFERPGIVGDTAYFPSFSGLVHPVKVSGPKARVEEAWNLVPEAERAEGWAPSGIGITDVDDQGRLYVLMHPGAVDGTHNGGGPEVWVFDPKSQTRVSRIKLQEWGLTIAVSRGEKPWLLVTNPTTMVVEVYAADTGEYIKTISDFGQETPLLIHGTR